MKFKEALEEGTKKIKDYWINRGKNPRGKSHHFKSKKAANNQRKAMFANGFKG